MIEKITYPSNGKTADRLDVVLVNGVAMRVVSELQGGLLDYYYHRAIGKDDEEFREAFSRIGHAAHPHYRDVSEDDKRALITEKSGPHVPLT